MSAVAYFMISGMVSQIIHVCFMGPADNVGFLQRMLPSG